MADKGLPLLSVRTMSLSHWTSPLAAFEAPRRVGGWIAGLGTALGLGALAASSCCALPVGLAALGATGAVFSGLETLANLRPVLLGGAALALAAGWGLFIRSRYFVCQPGGSCASSRAPRGFLLLLGGTVLVALALAWAPYFEASAIRLTRLGSTR